MSTGRLVRFIFTWGVICLPSLAFAADERIVLLLTGTACPQGYAALNHTLTRVPGVRRIDLHTVPDHALIDADTAVTDVEGLTAQVNDVLATYPTCRATSMKSCISAAPRTARDQVSPEPLSTARHSR
jgi:hypothetical protein